MVGSSFRTYRTAMVARTPSRMLLKLIPLCKLPCQCARARSEVSCDGVDRGRPVAKTCGDRLFHAKPQGFGLRSAHRGLAALQPPQKLMQMRIVSDERQVARVLSEFEKVPVRAEDDLPTEIAVHLRHFACPQMGHGRGGRDQLAAREVAAQPERARDPELREMAVRMRIQTFVTQFDGHTARSAASEPHRFVQGR